MYQWCGFKSRRGKNKNLTALKSNSNTVWFNFQTYIYTDNVRTCILFLFCKSKSQKQLSTFTEESKNKLSSNHFQGCLQSCSTWLRYHKSHTNFMSKYHWSLFYLFITSISKSIGGKICKNNYLTSKHLWSVKEIM